MSKDVLIRLAERAVEEDRWFVFASIPRGDEHGDLIISLANAPDGAVAEVLVEAVKSNFDRD